MAQTENTQQSKSEAMTRSVEVQRLVMRSIAESAENRRRMAHNATAKTEDLITYDNIALLDMVAGLDKALSA